MVNVTANIRDYYFERARLKYFECINCKSNEDLKNEINIPIESIIIKEANLKFIFSEPDLNKFTIETCLSLTDINGIVIGKYEYQESNNGDPIDDSLVFY